MAKIDDDIAKARAEAMSHIGRMVVIRDERDVPIPSLITGVTVVSAPGETTPSGRTLPPEVITTFHMCDFRPGRPGVPADRTDKAIADILVTK